MPWLPRFAPLEALPTPRRGLRRVAWPARPRRLSLFLPPVGAAVRPAIAQGRPGQPTAEARRAAQSRAAPRPLAIVLRRRRLAPPHSAPHWQRPERQEPGP